MSERFYINWPLKKGPVLLEGSEAHHLSAVCRLRPGDQVCLFNGDGREYSARILEAGKRAVALEIEAENAVSRELPFGLEVAAPLPKGDRGQFMVEKLTELGAVRYVPLACRRSVVHPGEAKLQKLKRYVVEASKQCGRNMLMGIEPVTEWADYCLPRPDEIRWLAHPVHSAAPHGEALSNIRNLRLVVGPEGGFTDEEASLGAEHGWRLIQLGARILRVETAALALAAIAGLGRA